MENRFVEKLRGLSPLNSADVAALRAATLAPRTVAARRDLIREGDRPGPVFVVLEGWACRYKILPNGTRQVLALLMPCDSCDLHVGLLAEMDHSIQTITPASVATIDREAMDAIMDTHRGVAKAMYSARLIDEGHASLDHQHGTAGEHRACGSFDVRTLSQSPQHRPGV